MRDAFIDPANTAVQAPERANALPASFYVGADSLARDRQAIFASDWQLVGHASQFRKPGDHLSVDIAGVPLLVVLDSHGSLIALHNVCRHRAGPLAVCGEGDRLRLRCRYHAWTYALDGRLTAAPEMASAADFDIAGIRLPKARVESWRGLVFASLRMDASSIDSLLVDLDQRLGEREFGHYVFRRQVAYEIACDWKVYVDNYLEGYHIPHIHPELNDMLDYRSYVTETGQRWSLQHSPLESADALYGSGEALYVFLWPNAMLNLLPDRLQINRVLPRGDGRCRVEFDYLYPGTLDDAGLAARHDRDHAFSDHVQHEDVGICQAVQRGLASGSYVSGRLNPLRENGVHHFQELLRAAYRNLPSQAGPV